MGQCIWEFRRVYTMWAKNRQEYGRAHAVRRSEDAALANPTLFGPLLEAGYLSEPEAAVLSTNFEDIPPEQPDLTQAVIGMVIEGFVDTDISDRLRLNPRGGPDAQDPLQHSAVRHGPRGTHLDPRAAPHPPPTPAARCRVAVQQLTLLMLLLGMCILMTLCVALCCRSSCRW
ncbi:hypothetical protein ABZT02_35080 [Streptomyces sp. NPDC005402]|uniref:hypothetical protein n=1 Tax=Streptomyces sp. NPDC005402 TaxID=3155338 RepID=UPI0033BEC781